MRENDSFYDIAFIFHPADSDKVGRIAAQIRATGVTALFSEDQFGNSAESLRAFKAGLLRAYTVAFAMSPSSAESQLCNELLQGAVGKGKRLVTLILDDDIEVEVHPSIAQNPYVFFREDDDLAARVDELRAYLSADANLKLHTELLALAEAWRDSGRPPELLLPPARLEEARGWLAGAPARQPKPSALQLEYLHSSRRQPPRRWRPRRPRQIALGLVLALALGAGLLLLLRAAAGWRGSQAAGALTNEARTQIARTAAEATAASDSAVGLIDHVAATGAAVRSAVAENATAESITATALARLTQTARAKSDLRATQMRATEIAGLERGDVASRLLQAGEAALERGDAELALALAWEAKNGLDDPRRAYRLLRRAASVSRSATMNAVAMLEIHPTGAVFALLPSSRDRLHIYDAETWARLYERADHEGEITALVFSGDGGRMISAADDGEIIIRDGSSGAAEQRLRRHRGAVTALALSPDGARLVSAGSDPLLVAWDISSGEELATYASGGDGGLALHDLLVTADGERVIGWSDAGGAPVMAQWTADTLELLSADSGGRVYRGVDAGGGIGYSGGSSLPAYPGDSNTGDLILWDLASGGQRARLTDGFNWSFLTGDNLAAATDELLFVAFFERLALVVVANSDTGQRANLVDVEDGRLLRRFSGEIAAQVTSAAFIDADTIMSATADNRVLLWSSSDGRFIREIGRTAQGLEALRVNRGANLLIAHTADGAAHLWQFEGAAAQPSLTLQDALPGTTISPSGAALLVVEEDGLSLRDVDSGEALVRLPAALVSAAGHRFAAYVDGRLAVYDIETGAETRRWDWAAGPIADLHISPDGERLLVLSETNELWLARGDAGSPRRLGEAAARPALVRFAPSGGAMLSLQDERAVIWDGELGVARAAYPLGAADRADVQAAFSADGSRLIVYVQLGDGLASINIVELADHAVWRQSFVDVHSAALSSDGQRLSLAYSDGRIQVVSTAGGAVIHQLRPDAGLASKLHYLPDSKTLATAIGSELMLWDAEAGVADHRFAHPYPLAGFSLSRDGRRILTVDERGAYRLWRVESAEELLARIEAAHKPRELTCAERERFLAAPLCE